MQEKLSSSILIDEEKIDQIPEFQVKRIELLRIDSQPISYEDEILFKQNYTCNLCQDVVIEPVICDKCNMIWCTKCLRNLASSADNEVAEPTC